MFGEDVAEKGGLYGVTRGLQDKYCRPGYRHGLGTTSTPLATEKIYNYGTIRWRAANKFAAPIIIQTGVGYLNYGNLWHSVCDESVWTHAMGWQVVFPSNREDVVGFLRAALRSNNPTIFIEHREHRSLLYDNAREIPTRVTASLCPLVGPGKYKQVTN